MGGLFSEYQIPDTLAGMPWGSLEGMNWAFQPFDLLVFLGGPAANCMVTFFVIVVIPSFYGPFLWKQTESGWVRTPVCGRRSCLLSVQPRILLLARAW